MNFKTFLASVESIRVNQANYQPVVICHLVNSENFTDTQRNIAEDLAVKNGLDKADYQKFMSSCPVWKVLSSKGLIEKIDGKYSLSVVLSPEQKAQVKAVCKELMK